MKKIFLSLIIFNFFNLSAMEFDPIFQEKTTDDHIKSALVHILDQSNLKIKYNPSLINDFHFFHALTIIKAIIFLQKHFPKQIPFEESENIRNKITEQASSWLIKKYENSTTDDFLKYCKNTNESLRAIARNEKNPILKKAFMSGEISDITTPLLASNLTVLHWVAIFGLEQMLIYLLDQTDCNIDRKYAECKFGIHIKTPLYYCVSNGLLLATKKLLELGVNPEGATVRLYTEFIASNPGEFKAIPWITTTHQAVLWPNKPELLSTLIEHKVDTNLDSGKTNITINNQTCSLFGNPLEWAQQIENYEAIEMLQNYNPPAKHFGAVPSRNWFCTLL